MFEPPFVSYPVGSNTWAVATADLNADGRLDLVTANIAGLAEVLLGNGDGSFSYKRAYNLHYGGYYVPYVVIADFNMDGRPDLAAMGSMLPGNGDGTFAASISFVANGTDAAVGDLNADGRPDLVVAPSSQADHSSIAVLLGNGDGTFAESHVAAGLGEMSVAIADLDGDGSEDVAVGDGGPITCVGHLCLDSSYVSVLLGNGNGTFRPRTGFDSAEGPTSRSAMSTRMGSRT
jgi:hypothetical protein